MYKIAKKRYSHIQLYIYIYCQRISQIVDYNKCPKCGSVDLQTLNKSDYELEMKKANTVSSTTSSADELKKFKELLDDGVITQEEFDAKKKQLLGL